MGSQIVDVLGASKVDGVAGLRYGLRRLARMRLESARSMERAQIGWYKGPIRIRGDERIEECSLEIAKRAAEERVAALEAAALAASAR
jgi:hypothetical protein